MKFKQSNETGSGSSEKDYKKDRWNIQANYQKFKLAFDRLHEEYETQWISPLQFKFILFLNIKI